MAAAGVAGLRREDIIPIDSRSHLEVADKKHRYAKNLRLYFKEYHRQNGIGDLVDAQPPSSSGAQTPSRKWVRYEPFFQWLDNEEKLPELEECPRCTLDEDRVEYLTTDEERFPYEIAFRNSGDGLWRLASTGELVNTGPKGWIFVLLNERMYACEKRTNTFPRFHHSSFFAGAGVNAAGMIVCVDGRLTKLFPHSGHYRPHDRHLYSLLAYLRDRGVQLRGVQVDVQRVLKLSRQVEKDGVKSKKTESALYMDAETAYNFLRSKSMLQESGVLSQIQLRRKVDPADATLSAGAAGEVEAAGSSGSGSGARSRRPSRSNIPAVSATAAVVGTVSTDSCDGAVGSVGGRSPRPAPSPGPLVPGPAPGPRSRAGSRSEVPPPLSPAKTIAASGDCDTPGDTLNISASTASSTNSPFFSPTANYQYPGYGSAALSAAALRGQGQAQAQQNQDPTARLTMGVRASSPLVNESSGAVPATGGVVVGDPTALKEPGKIPGITAGEAREKVLSGILLPSSTAPAVSSGGGGGAVMPATTVTKVSSKGLSALHPPSPPIAASNGSGKTAKPVATSSATSTATISAGSLPAPVPIKKVTSHTSISSSFGSNSYLNIHYPAGRSRSHSKADGELDYQYTYDIRALLADSPSVAPAPHNYSGSVGGDQSSIANGSVSSDILITSPNNTANNSAANSVCHSRTRSRNSSFNTPYTSASTATYANNNYNFPITESSLLSRLHANVAAAANSTALSGQGESSGESWNTPRHQVQAQQQGGLGGVKVSPGQAPSSGEPSPTASRALQQHPLQQASGDNNSERSKSSSFNHGKSAAPNMHHHHPHHAQPQPLQPFPAISASTASISSDLLGVSADGHGVEVGDLLAEEPEGRVASPVPSFASSLSSCDSLPHDLLDLLEDAQRTAGDGLGEGEADGDGEEDVEGGQSGGFEAVDGVEETFG